MKASRVYLTHIGSSPVQDASITRHLSEAFVKSWRHQHPDGEIITRDLSATTAAGDHGRVDRRFLHP